LDHLKNIYKQLLTNPIYYKNRKEIFGINLENLNIETLKLTTKFFDSKGYLKKEEIISIQQCLNQLKIVSNVLEKQERQHFTSLKQLAQEIFDITRVKNLSDDEIQQRYNWSKVYDQIRIILNELDPSGVADMVDNEYDDLNFAVYSQLLKSKDDQKMFEIIEFNLNYNYHTSVAINSLNETVKKLMKIKVE